MHNIKLTNLGTVNKNAVFITGKNDDYLKIYFSYETPLSFQANIAGQFTEMTRQNEWSTTTGKLLNECEPDKTKRVDSETFTTTLNSLMSRI